jgi:hypothetical protein
MGTSELNQSQPVIGFLAPAGANRATLQQPRERSLDHPASCRKGRFSWYITFWCWFLATSPSVFDMRNVALVKHKLMHVCVIIAGVSAQMLLRARTVYHYCQHHTTDYTLVVRIGSSDMNCHWRATLVDQQMPLTVALAAVGRVLASRFTAQWRSRRAAINRLPSPLDAMRAGVEAQKHLEQLGKSAVTLPGLEALVQHTAGNTEPVTVNGFPLSADPQHVPDAVQHSAPIGAWSSWPTLALVWRFGQQRLEFAPQRARHAKIVDIGWFCDRLGRHGVSFLTQGLSTFIVSRLRRFVHLLPIFG